jgi:SAM-dependent methyltransferase
VAEGQGVAGATYTRFAPGYAFSNAWELARRRLDLLEECHDASSFGHAEALGVGPGWRCLDAGAGGGSFARGLAERVSPGGTVVAADLDVVLLGDLDAPNIEVRQVDLVSDELPRQEFDFVHTRLVLLHIPARDQVLERLSQALKPGGVLMVEEHDSFPVLAAATGAYRDAWKAFIATSRAAGVGDEWARELPGRLAALGLVDIDAKFEVPLFRGGSPFAELWRLTWEQVRDRVAAVGESAEDIERGQAELADEQLWFYGPGMVIASGRAPRQP